jgi:hypothetical protein
LFQTKDKQLMIKILGDIYNIKWTLYSNR